MRMFFTLFLVFAFSIVIYGQNVIQVTAGLNQISAAYETASAGDILELITDGGIYKEDSALQTTFPITIRAAAGLSEKPVWEGADRHLLDFGSGNRHPLDLAEHIRKAKSNVPNTFLIYHSEDIFIGLGHRAISLCK